MRKVIVLIVRLRERTAEGEPILLRSYICDENKVNLQAPMIKDIIRVEKEYNGTVINWFFAYSE